MRHGYCTAELIVWYVMKQFILPPDINEVTMQKEILTPPRVPPATLDRGCAWLEEMQHRLNLCIKTKQNAHPRTSVAFVNDTLSGITQYYRTVGNIWDSLYAKHQLRESNITLDRVYAMLAEFLIELKLHEEQDKFAQIVTGSSSTVKHSMYDEHISASKGQVLVKGKATQGDGKGGKSKWRAACDEYWKPGGCSQGHHCPKHHPRRQPGRCAICGSTRHYTSQCTRPVKPKAKNADWDESTWHYDDDEWHDAQWESKSMKRLRERKEKGKDLSIKESPKARMRQGLSLQCRRRLHSSSKGDRSQPKAKPEARTCMTNDFLFAMMSTKSKPTWRHSTWNGIDYVICAAAEPQKKPPVFKAGKWSLIAGSRISLYGHGAESVKHFTLHFDMAEQCDSLDRAWFGEMWFPVEKYTHQVQSSVTHDSIPDPADLDLDEGYSEPDLCFSRSQVRDPAYALLDSGATHVLLPGHMLPKGARSFEVTVNLAVGKEKARCWRNQVHAEDKAHPLLPLGRVANLLDTKFVWENGEAVMQCRDKGKWRTMTKFEIRNNMAYASQMQFEVLKGRKKGTRVNFLGEIFWVKQGAPNGPFSATKSLVYCFSCPQIIRQPVDPVVPDPVREDTPKYNFGEVLSAPPAYLNRELSYIFVYCLSCRYLVELGLRQLGLPVPNHVSKPDKHLWGPGLGRGGGLVGYGMVRAYGNGNSDTEPLHAPPMHTPIECLPSSRQRSCFFQIFRA